MFFKGTSQVVFVCSFVDGWVGGLVPKRASDWIVEDGDVATLSA